MKTSLFVRLNGVGLLIGALFLYYLLGASWWFFILLLLTPDLAFLAYLKDPKIGALTYNILHNLLLACIMGISGFVLQIEWLTALGIIFAAHIGMDYMVGYGIKYPDNPKKTHIQRV